MDWEWRWVGRECSFPVLLATILNCTSLSAAREMPSSSCHLLILGRQGVLQAHLALASEYEHMHTLSPLHTHSEPQELIRPIAWVSQSGSVSTL